MRSSTVLQLLMNLCYTQLEVIEHFDNVFVEKSQHFLFKGYQMCYQSCNKNKAVIQYPHLSDIYDFL